MIKLEMDDEMTCYADSDMTFALKESEDFIDYLVNCSIYIQASWWAVFNSVKEDVMNKFSETQYLSQEQKDLIESKLFDIAMIGLTKENYKEYIKEKQRRINTNLKLIKNTP